MRLWLSLDRWGTTPREVVDKILGVSMSMLGIVPSRLKTMCPRRGPKRGVDVEDESVKDMAEIAFPCGRQAMSQRKTETNSAKSKIR